MKRSRSRPVICPGAGLRPRARNPRTLAFRKSVVSRCSWISGPGHGPPRNDNLALKLRFCHSSMRCCATLRKFSGTRLKSTTSIVNSVGALEFIVDCRKRRMRHRSRTLDADVDIRALGRRPRRARAEQKDAVGRIGQMPPDHQSGEFGRIRGILDHKQETKLFR